MRYLLILVFFVSCSKQSDQTYTPKEINLYGDGVIMLNKINQSRNEIGLNPVVPEERLTDIAQRYTIEMDGTKVLSHDGFYKRQVESGCYSFGECLSYNYNVSSSFDAYVLSKSHNQTLTNSRYTHMGYGRTGKYECVLLGGYDFYKKQSIVDTLTVKIK